MKQAKKIHLIHWVALMGLTTTIGLSAVAANTVQGTGSYNDAGPGYEVAYKNACLDAQIQCLNKSVKRITNWDEFVHHVEGYFTITEQATFECLPDVATEANLSDCAQP